jgi:hypothetical protein
VDSEEFERIFERQVAQSREVLLTKAKEYATDDDRLHNFEAASALIGGTPEQALWGFAVKHLVSISDMIKDAEYHSEEKWDEKIGDAINYLILLRAQVFDTENLRVSVNPSRIINQTFLTGPGETRVH